MVKHQNPEKFNAFVGGKMNKVLFAVFLIGIGIAAAQTPPDQERVAGSVRSVIPEPDDAIDIWETANELERAVP